jgi:L-Ala-D/L-Glu epimerase
MIVSCTQLERWPMKEPFEIAREIICEQHVLRVELSDGRGNTGLAEAAGVDYDGETPQRIADEIAAMSNDLHPLPDVITGMALLKLLPAGGARNALDCALWDLRAKQNGVPAWKAAGLPPLHRVTTAFTIGLGDEAATRRKLRVARGFSIIKLKLDAQRHMAVVQMAREEHPSARLLVDANQAWSLEMLKELAPQLHRAGVALIEQPLARGDDALLHGLQFAVPLAADESCTDCASLDALVGRYQYINIKLDKCGGLTEALRMVHRARQLGLGLMVGNMCGTSLAMAPAFLIAQSCEFADLDGPLLQIGDRPTPLTFKGDLIEPPSADLWG